MSEKEVAQLLSVSVGLLRKWRYGGEGPPWLRLSRAVRYRLDKLEAWVEMQEQLTRAVEGQALHAGVFPGLPDQCKLDKSMSALSVRKASPQHRR